MKQVATAIVALAGVGCAVFAPRSADAAGSCPVRIEDFSKFQICFGFPATAPPGIDCALFDFDGNGVVDLRDFDARRFDLRVRLLVSPARSLITYSQTMDFNATVVGSGNPPVNWIVSPVPGSEPGESLGTIDANGLYSPPSPLDLHAASQVLVSAGGPESESSCVSILGTLTSSPPVSLSLPGLGGAGGSPANVTIASPPTALVLPDIDGSNVLPPNTTVASPPVAVDFDNP